MLPMRVAALSSTYPAATSACWPPSVSADAMQVRRRYALGAEPAATDPPARGNSQPFKGDCVARVTRRLSLWRAPIVRRVLAPELTTVQFRRELLDGDRGAALVNAVGVWFTVLLLCLHGFRSNRRVMSTQVDHFFSGFSSQEVQVTMLEATRDAAGSAEDDLAGAFEGPFYEWFGMVRSNGDASVLTLD